MKIAAIQHRVRDRAEEDARALAAAAAHASANGAELIILPDVPWLAEGDGSARSLLVGLTGGLDGFCVVPSTDPASRGSAVVAALPERFAQPDGRATVASIVVGDACMDAVELRRAAALSPSLAVLSPRSETDLQAESMLEFGIELSDSLAGVVVIAECSGAEPLDTGHGGSAIIVLGDVVAEALDDDDVLIADIVMPFPQPSPREPVPQVPPLLAQRFAHHRGRGEVEHGPDVS
jgi:hypothetical protein